MTGPERFWYGADDAARGHSILTALRTYHAADAAMRRRTRTAMSMGENEMLALRLVVTSAGAGRLATPREIAASLGVSSASVTSLLDRLTATGHVVRGPHPTDRRSVTIAPTALAEDEVRRTLGDMHERMLSATHGFTDEQASAIVEFLESLTAAVDQVGSADTLSVAAG